MKKKWISIAEYADRFGKNRTAIYHDIKWGRIPADAWAKIKVEREVYVIREDFKPKNLSTGKVI